ncbi:MAG: ABC transporter ATP-binding protein [Coriobacteriia bacterium]
MAEIEVTGLRVVYKGVEKRVEALGGLDLKVADGEPVAVIGPSGCGKSTLLLTIAGLVEPTAGRVAIGGEPVGGPRLKTALILQDFGLLPWKSVLSNAALGLRIRRVPRAEANERAREALSQVGIADFARAYPGELSGGMRQRLALARALALDADVLLMDEPLSALDALTRESLQGLLLELWRMRRHTQVIVTHSIEEAVFLGRRVVVLSPRPGRIHRIVDNPRMGEPGFRASEEFYERCAELRGILKAEGAFSEVAAG